MPRKIYKIQACQPSSRNQGCADQDKIYIVYSRDYLEKKNSYFLYRIYDVYSSLKLYSFRRPLKRTREALYSQSRTDEQVSPLYAGTKLKKVTRRIVISFCLY